MPLIWNHPGRIAPGQVAHPLVSSYIAASAWKIRPGCQISDVTDRSRCLDERWYATHLEAGWQGTFLLVGGRQDRRRPSYDRRPVRGGCSQGALFGFRDRARATRKQSTWPNCRYPVEAVTRAAIRWAVSPLSRRTRKLSSDIAPPVFVVTTGSPDLHPRDVAHYRHQF